MIVIVIVIVIVIEIFRQDGPHQQTMLVFSGVLYPHIQIYIQTYTYNNKYHNKTYTQNKITNHTKANYNN